MNINALVFEKLYSRNVLYIVISNMIVDTYFYRRLYDDRYRFFVEMLRWIHRRYRNSCSHGWLTTKDRIRFVVNYDADNREEEEKDEAR